MPFFKQLLRPMCDPNKSDIADDPRMVYYSEVKKWLAKYTSTIRMCVSYKHNYSPDTVEEFLAWDDIVTKNECTGRINDYLCIKWDWKDNLYDPVIATAIYHSRLLSIEKYHKLCDNDLAPKHREPDYDPAYKYNYTWRVSCIT